MNNIKITTANTHVRKMILRNAISLEILEEQRHMFELEKKITNLHTSNALKKEQYIIEMNKVLNDQLQEYTAQRAQETGELSYKINELDIPTKTYMSLISQKNICEANMRNLYLKFMDLDAQIPEKEEVTNYIFGNKTSSLPQCSRQTTLID